MVISRDVENDATVTAQSPFGALPTDSPGRANPFHLAPWERWLLAAALVATCLIPVLGMFAVKWASRPLAAATLYAGLFAMVMVVAHAGVTLYLEARELRDLPRLILTRLDRRFGAEHGVIESLALAFSRNQLEHARDSLALELAQTRRRIGFMVGAVEQLGIVPAGVAAFFYAHKVYVERQLANSTLTAIFASVVGLYVMAFLFVVTAQRLERWSLLLSHAAERKRTLEGAPR